MRGSVMVAMAMVMVMVMVMVSGDNIVTGGFGVW